MARSYNFQYPKGREVQLIVCWNGGDPFLIDGRYRFLHTMSFEPCMKKDLLRWAALNQARCVGFEGDSRPPRRSTEVRSVSWAVVG